MLLLSEVDALQLIVNCFVPWESGFVMLQKPRRGWWYLPGGKVEDDELWRQAAIREFREESGLSVRDAELRGVYRVRIEMGENLPPKERLIAQFVGRDPSGILLSEHREGKLAVVEPGEIDQLPMDDGDRMMLRMTIASEQRGETRISFGKFHYDTEHRLTAWELDATASLPGLTRQ